MRTFGSPGTGHAKGPRRCRMRPVRRDIPTGNHARPTRAQKEQQEMPTVPPASVESRGDRFRRQPGTKTGSRTCGRRRCTGPGFQTPSRRGYRDRLRRRDVRAGPATREGDFLFPRDPRWPKQGAGSKRLGRLLCLIAITELCENHDTDRYTHVPDRMRSGSSPEQQRGSRRQHDRNRDAPT